VAGNRRECQGQSQPKLYWHRFERRRCLHLGILLQCHLPKMSLQQPTEVTTTTDRAHGQVQPEVQGSPQTRVILVGIGYVNRDCTRTHAYTHICAQAHVSNLTQFLSYFRRSGATCSGKTTLAKHLHNILPDSFIIHQDVPYPQLPKNLSC
jgi:hypothetical protein